MDMGIQIQVPPLATNDDIINFMEFHSKACEGIVFSVLRIDATLELINKYISDLIDFIHKRKYTYKQLFLINNMNVSGMIRYDNFILRSLIYSTNIIFRYTNISENIEELRNNKDFSFLFTLSRDSKNENLMILDSEFYMVVNLYYKNINICAFGFKFKKYGFNITEPEVNFDNDKLKSNLSKYYHIQTKRKVNIYIGSSMEATNRDFIINFIYNKFNGRYEIKYVNDFKWILTKGIAIFERFDLITCNDRNIRTDGKIEILGVRDYHIDKLNVDKHIADTILQLDIIMAEYSVEE